MTLERLRSSKDAHGKPLYHGKRQGLTFALSDALCWLLASRSLILDSLELKKKGPGHPVLAEGIEGLLAFYADLCHVQVARAAGESGRICAELTFGYQDGPEASGGCAGDEASIRSDYPEYARLRLDVDACLSGSRLAKDRAAQALTQVMIPEALDYPV